MNITESVIRYYTPDEDDVVDGIVEIPDNIQVLNDWAFSNLSNCKDIEKIIIPYGLHHIGAHCFDGCINLKKLILPSSLRSIGDYAFLNCSSLEEIDIPDGVDKLGIGSFSGCISLKHVYLSNSLREIKFATFHRCKSLTKLFFHMNLIIIDGMAFQDCTSLSSIEFEIFSKIEHIDEGAFYNTNLNKIKAPLLKYYQYSVFDTVKNNAPHMKQNKIRILKGDINYD